MLYSSPACLASWNSEDAAAYWSRHAEAAAVLARNAEDAAAARALRLQAPMFELLRHSLAKSTQATVPLASEDETEFKALLCKHPSLAISWRDFGALTPIEYNEWLQSVTLLMGERKAFARLLLAAKN